MSMEMRSTSSGGNVASGLLGISRRLAREVDRMRFGPPVTHVYNPLRYAAAPHEQYLRRFGSAKGRVLLLGMNPGPFGMAQTGVPFGDVALVRDWLGIRAHVKKPRQEHPQRPVVGFNCVRSEVSGSRLWGWARDRFGAPERFFDTFFVANYCPLVFMEKSGRNRTPNLLAKREREALFKSCDSALRALAVLLEPRCVIGVGGFAERRAREALAGLGLTIGGVLHPSPANPRANSGWAAVFEHQLVAHGIRIFLKASPSLFDKGGQHR
jgi:single-strand selective monofunctional uracil DNA glycosylase